MSQEVLMERLFEALIDGDRKAACAIVDEQFENGVDAEGVITKLFWPAYELLDRMHRADQISMLSHNMAVRLLRVMTDRYATRLTRTVDGPPRSVLAFCGGSECEELGAQMAVDILESAGFDVRFVGAGVANDEILEAVHKLRPDVLLSFCSAASDLPGLRSLIDTLQEIGASKNVQLVVGGGVFNRAEGLAEEIGADLWAVDPLELAEMMILDPETRAIPEQRTVGKIRRVKAAA